MQRIAIAERPDWREQAAAVGFRFHTIAGEPYWDESAYYRFSLAQVEDHIEDPTQELLGMCYAAVEHIVGDDALLQRLRIPEPFWDYLRASWGRGDKDLYGRFDLAYDGTGPAKLLEFNADTPTGLFEAAVFQWLWLEDGRRSGRLPAGADQFNSISEKLIAAFEAFGFAGATLHFACVREHEEDRGTVAYLEDCARQADVVTKFVHVEEIGVDAQGRFADLDDQPIDNLFKLYPWEWMAAEEFGSHLLRDRTRIVEPPWKMTLSNKGLLPILWEGYPGHPLLLPSYFEEDPQAASLGARYVRKPLLGREGANVEIVDGSSRSGAPGPYGEEGWVVQALQPLPDFEGRRPVLGSWVAAGQACGVGIREDAGPITTNASRFVPHVILD